MRARLRSNAVSTSDLELLGAGREAEIFAWRDGRALRLARDPSNGAMIDREVSALAAAQQRRRPACRAFTSASPSTGDRASSSTASTASICSARSRAGPGQCGRWGRPSASSTQACTGSRRPAGLPDLHDELRHRLASPLVPDEVRTRALDRLEALPAGDRLLHGDFHPANLLRGRNGYVVIDWTNGMSGDPAADVARTILLMGGGKLADGTPVVIRVIAPVARRLLLASYLARTRARAALDRGLVDRWLPVWAAARPRRGHRSGTGVPARARPLATSVSRCPG